MTEAFIKGSMVTWAIERSKETTQMIAHRLNIKPEKLVLWQKEEERPSFRQAEDLAKKLKIPFGYLYLMTPPKETLPLPDLRVMSPSSYLRPSPDFLDVIYDALRKQQWYHNYLKNEGVDELPFIGKFNLNSKVKDIAVDISNTLDITDKLRKQSKSWSAFFTALIRKAEQNHILVLRSGIVGNDTHRKLNVSEFRGFAISDDLSPLIFINENDYKTAQIFTLVHELSHLWLSQSGVSNPDYMLRAYEQKHEVDRLCDSVSAEVLVPSDDFNMRWNDSLKFDYNINQLVSHYRVSAFVVLRCAYMRGKIEHKVFQNKYQELIKKIKDKVPNEGGDFYNLLMSRNGNTFTSTILNIVGEGRIEPTEAASLLNLKVSSLRNVEVGIVSRLMNA
jgi:Zn-dependent peptidase ImmA (M78 family)